MAKSDPVCPKLPRRTIGRPTSSASPHQQSRALPRIPLAAAGGYLFGGRWAPNSPRKRFLRAHCGLPQAGARHHRQDRDRRRRQPPSTRRASSSSRIPMTNLPSRRRIALKEQAGAGETTVIAVGTDASQETLRTALAMGIDRAVLLQSAGSADGLAVARALAAELKARRLRPDPVRQARGGRLQPSGRRHGGGAARAALHHGGGADDADRRRPRGRARNRGWRRGDGLLAPRRRHLRQGAQQPAAALAQGHHGREEEAARREAGHARVPPRSRSPAWSSRAERQAGPHRRRGCRRGPRPARAAAQRGQGPDDRFSRSPSSAMARSARSRTKCSRRRAAWPTSSGGTVDAVVLGAGAVAGMDQLGGFGADRVLARARTPISRCTQPDGASADHRVDRRRVRRRGALRPRPRAATSPRASRRGSASPAPPTSRRSASRAAR